MEKIYKQTYYNHIISEVSRNFPLWMMVLIIVVSQDTLAFSPLVSGGWTKVRMIVLLGLAIGLSIKAVLNNTLYSDTLLVYVLFNVFILLGMAFNMDFGTEYWLLSCLIAYLIINNYSVSSIARQYIKVMFCICLIYTAGWFVLRMFPSMMNTHVFHLLEKFKIVYGHSNSYKHYISGTAAIRSYAIFREPGVYQMYVILALMIDLFHQFKRNAVRILRIGIFCMAIFAARSTTGYICLILILAMFCVEQMLKNKAAVILIIIGTIAGLMYGGTIANNIILKFTAVGSASHSVMSRTASITTNIYMWLVNPVWGVGSTALLQDFAGITEHVFHITAGVYKITDNTNTVLILFVVYGIIPGILLLCGTYKCAKKIAGETWLALGLLIIFILLYMGEALNVSVYPYMIMFAGYQKISKIQCQTGVAVKA